MIERPIIIIGAPRSGTTILQRCLALHPELWHLRAESHHILEGPFHPNETKRKSNRCTADDANNHDVNALRQNFYRQAINISCVLTNPGWLFSTNGLIPRLLSAAAIKILGYSSKLRKPSSIRFLEKTPKNSLRVSLLNQIFPDALFVWNQRVPEDNIDSLVAGWNTIDKIGPVELPRFARASYPVADELELQNYSGKWWKFALVPEWKSLHGRAIGEVAAWQYYQCNRYALKDFEKVDGGRVISVKHERFVREPVSVIEKVLARANLSMESAVRQFALNLPRVNSTRDDNSEVNKLRYPEQVQHGIKAIPELQELRSRMGYV